MACSYLSIYNDTQDLVLLKMGNWNHDIMDGAGSYVESASIAAVCLGVTSGLEWVATGLKDDNHHDETIHSCRVLSITPSTSSSSLSSSKTYTSTLCAVKAKVTECIRNIYESKGYSELAPGQMHVVETKTLLQSKQCHVVRIRTAPDGNVVEEESTTMRPLCFGPEEGSTIQYSISNWARRGSPFVVMFQVRMYLMNGDQICSNVGIGTAFPPGNYIWTSYFGSVLRCNANGSVDLVPKALRSESIKWQPFCVKGNKYVWKSSHHQGRYLRANPSGSVDTATNPDLWEEWDDPLPQWNDCLALAPWEFSQCDSGRKSALGAPHSRIRILALDYVS